MTAPTLADALVWIARIAAVTDDPFVADAVDRSVYHLTPDLTDHRRDLWWGELCHWVDRTQTYGRVEDRPHDERGIDYEARVAEACRRLTGVE